MKKFLLTLVVAMCCTLSAQCKKFYVGLRITQPQCESNEFKNDSISIRLYANNDLFLGVSIQNFLKERVSVEWGNVRWDREPVNINDHYDLIPGKVIGDVVIMPGESMMYDIIQNVCIRYAIRWYDKKYLKKGVKEKNKIIVPIRFSSGKVIDYTLEFEVFKEE